MSIAFNESGLIPRGLGPNHLLITRGMAVNFDWGGAPMFKRKEVEYYLDVLMPIARENYQEINLYSPLLIKREANKTIFSSVSKDIEEEISVRVGLDHSKLTEMLDALD